MLENWARFSFPRSLSISITFFLIQLKIKIFTAKKKLKEITVIYLYYHPSILISFNSESY